MGQGKSGWTHAFSGWITPGGMSIHLFGGKSLTQSLQTTNACIAVLISPFISFSFIFFFSLLIKNVSS
jgi:hypothetical protein